MTPYITRCPVGCAATLQPTAHRLPEGSLRRCPACGQFVSAVDETRYHETMQAFNAPGFNQASAREMERRWSVARRRLATAARLMGRVPHGARWVDIGCSRGQFVGFAARAGYTAEGVEPAPDIAAAARESGLNVRSGFLQDQRYPDAGFDGASLFEVVEHLRDPLPLMREIRRILKPGAVLLVSTGNTASWTVAVMGARWDYFHIEKDGGHVSFFNPGSLSTLAQRAGFETACIETARVKFHEKPETHPFVYTGGKLVAELLNWPARLAGRGHDMLAYLRRL
jgi:2-polyprenyl-6-hydroxyphenyl methylase/3-demethylubiquinone-9 3-methyltransferase